MNGPSPANYPRGSRTVTRGGWLKKFYFYNDMYLFLTRFARRRNFRDVSFDFELDATEMKGFVQNLTWFCDSQGNSWTSVLQSAQWHAPIKGNTLGCQFISSLTFFGLTYPFWEGGTTRRSKKIYRPQNFFNIKFGRKKKKLTSETEMEVRVLSILFRMNSQSLPYSWSWVTYVSSCIKRTAGKQSKSSHQHANYWVKSFHSLFQRTLLTLLQIRAWEHISPPSPFSTSMFLYPFLDSSVLWYMVWKQIKFVWDLHPLLWPI